jgi:hypothetical protein
MIWALAALGAVLLFLLLAPIGLEIALGNAADLVRSAQLTWAWGLLATDLARKRSPRSQKRPPEGAGAKTVRLGRPRLPSIRVITDGITPLVTLLCRLVRATHPRDLRVQVQLGLDDPGATGMLWGVLGPAVAVLEDVTGPAIAVEPVFTEAEFQWAARGRFTLIPAQLLGIVLAFVFSPAVVRVGLNLAKSRR